MKATNKSELWKKRLGDWVINPYVGCEHGCFHCYCPAMPGVKFHNNGRRQTDWGKYVFPKQGIVDALRRQLVNFTPEKARQTDWGDGWILLSFLTDCYTPVEADLLLTRECLKLILEAGHKVRLQTRSALCLEKYDKAVWAADTWEVLNWGHRTVSRFIPWPDTSRHWKRFLDRQKVVWLDKFLPSVSQTD